MSEQAEQKSEQRTNESKSVADMSLEEIQAEIARVDAEISQAPPLRTSLGSESGSSEARRRTPFTDARTGEEIVNEVGATRRDLIRQYESLEQDSRFNDDHRAEQMWKAYDKSRPVIEEKAKAARETLLRDAQRLEDASVPFPGGQARQTDNLQQLSLTQAERVRITEKLNYVNPAVARLKAKGKKAPDFEDSVVDTLRTEYKRGLDSGGPGGASVCRAALQIAEDRGIATDSVVDEFRSDWQRERLHQGQERRLKAHTVYSRVPLPSTPRPGGPKSIAEAGAGKSRTPYGVTKKSSGPAFPKRKKRPNWK